LELEKSSVNQPKMRVIWITAWTYVKILILIGINIVVFLPISSYILWVIFVIEVLIGIVVKIKIEKCLLIIKFLLINLIPIYLILYFVDYDWIQALLYFEKFMSKIFVLLISLVIFSQITPLNTMVISLAKIGVPKRISFILITVINFIPTLSAQLRIIVNNQKARGYRFSIINLRPILVPAIINLLDQSINLSLSLESRGFEL
jgi:energy-coupling factor transporter transmembrane protein EcfT